MKTIQQIYMEKQSAGLNSLLERAKILVATSGAVGGGLIGAGFAGEDNRLSGALAGGLGGGVGSLAGQRVVTLLAKRFGANSRTAQVHGLTSGHAVGSLGGSAAAGKGVSHIADKESK